MNTNSLVLAASCLAASFVPGISSQGAGPLPEFTFKAIALEGKNLAFAPTGELERPSLVKMEGRVEKPLGKYYLYYSPHKHAGVGLVYSDNIEGPWTEYKGNPVVEGAAIPDVRWIPETGKFHLWAHSKNKQTEMWTSADGLHFEHHSTSVAANNIGTRNATYTRAYEYPLERYGSKYIMLYSGFIEERGIRCVWLAHSKDGETWVQEKTPLVEPIEGENNDIYCPAMLQWQGRNFIVYQDHTSYRGGLVKYVELDGQLNPVGNRGERHVLIDPVPDSPIDNRYRGGEFYREGDTLYLYSGAGESPRIIVYATAKIGAPAETEEIEREESKTRGQDPYPSVEELPANDQLPDPFQFFGSDRKVKTRNDWEQRRAEMLKLIQYYSAGPAFPQTQNAQVKHVDSQQVYGGKATHYTAEIVMGPGHAVKCTFEYVLPNTDGPKPILFYICPKREYAEETIPWREKIVDRGYGFAWFLVGQIQGYNDHGPVKDAFAEVPGNTMMAWVWGINELIHYLDKAHKIDKVIVTGTSRYGKTAAMAGAVNERIDLTVPVTGGFGVRLFNAKDNKQDASDFDKRAWSNGVFPTFAGQLNKLPIDQHFVGALIAPRGLLGIMGDENNEKNVGHIEAYEALIPVYEWLGAKDNVGLYNHAPRGHGFGEDDVFTILDFADKMFYGKKPASGKAFNQISNPELVGFEWQAPPPVSD